MKQQAKIWSRLLLVAIAASLAACGGGSNNSSSSTTTTTSMSLNGVVHGGQAPISGSTITLYAASQQALSPATVVATALTDSQGNFTFTSFTCPAPITQMYVTSAGGNAGGGANSAIHMMSVLGQCQALHHSITVNELTTVAAAYAANRFIGPSGCVDCTGGAPSAVDNISGSAPGLPNAMGNAALLADAVYGTDATSLPTTAQCGAGSPPVNCSTLRKLNTLGNALAACVNSSGPASAQCTELFNCSVSGASYTSSACTVPGGSVLPTDTLQAVLSIARNPSKSSVAGIQDTASKNVLFSPTTSVNTDFTLGFNFVGGSLNLPQGIAIDSLGNVWVSSQNNGIVAKYSPNGQVLSGNGFGTGGNSPMGIAIDAADNAWVSNFNSNSVTVFNQVGTKVLSSPITIGGLNKPSAIAVSPLGDVWVANSNSATVSRYNSLGSAFGSSGFTVSSTPQGIAVDAAGYAWVANYGNNSMTELTPLGAFVNTIAAGPMSSPYGIAADLSGNIWLANTGSTNLTKVTVASEAYVSGANLNGGGISNPQSVAIDAAGNVWTANYAANSISELNSAGTAISPSVGFVGPGLNFPTQIAVDASGNIWAANAGGNSITVLFGAAAPTRTPLVNAIAMGFSP